MTTDLEQKIIRQIEYYFGDINLPRDKFLQEKIKEDDGWVTLEVLLTFKRLASLSTDIEVIASAVEKSENKLVVVSEDRKKLRRNPQQPLPELDEERKKEIHSRSAYAKGFPTDAVFDEILNFLEPYGPIEACIRRSTKDHKFKGSCFIIFKDVETCKKFVELESKLRNEKNAKKEKKEKGKAEEKPIEFPKGASIHFSGLEEGQTLTREELKEKIKEVGGIDVAYIDFNKGDLEGVMRFPEENNAMTNSKSKPFKLKCRLLKDEEEEEYLKKTSDAIIEMRKKQKQSSRSNRKRKGNFGNQGRESKHRKK
ncbi:hypothetical protein NQ317_000342 [Molorchus minor]|uniref:Uncharacterized protein n=1 Tax=Molorchus minor TaxID=1323400 RepID=A0ABQ9K2H5_9CUCU|nr:hypothetical protein NQ317_000342 [Molorchus minor]